MMRKKLDIVSIGEILIDFVGKEQSMRLADVTEFRRAAGGGPANMAVGAARLGAKTGFIGKVGADAFGRHLHEILEQNGVDTQGLIVDSAANTTLVFVALNQKGVPDFSFFRQGTADTLLRVDELPISLLQDAKILHFSSVSLTTEPSRSACLKAVEIARNSGALISFDPNLRLPLWPDSGSARKEIMAAAGLADILKMNDEEYLFLTGQSIECRKKKEDVFWSDRLKLLAVTRGEKGSMLFTHTDSLQFAGRTIRVVDTTGAGDAFMAGILTILADRPEMEGIDRSCLTKVGQWATAAATLACSHPGGIPSLPVREEVVELAKFIEPQ
ncbi:MAG: PfkB family carbohydrate kinase [Negativicutes bacterium]